MIPVQLFRERLALPASKEVLLSQIRNAVLSMWERRTNRLWTERKSFSKIFRVRRQEQELFLKLYPVTKLVSVEGKHIGETDFSEIDATSYYLDEDAGRLERLSGYWPDFVKVVWDGGYAEIEDGDIIEACLVQAEFMLVRFSQEKVAVSSLAFEAGSTSFLSADVHPHFKATAESRRSYA